MLRQLLPRGTQLEVQEGPVFVFFLWMSPWRLQILVSHIENFGMVFLKLREVLAHLRVGR